MKPESGYLDSNKFIKIRVELQTTLAADARLAGEQLRVKWTRVLTGSSTNEQYLATS
jgi:hypothetical protein